MELVCYECGTIKPNCGCVSPTCNCGNKVFITEDAYYKIKSKGIDLDNITIHTGCPHCKLKGYANGHPILFCTKYKTNLKDRYECKP